MKKETTKKSKLWVVILAIAVLLLAAGGAVLAFVLGGGQGNQNVTPGTPGPTGPRADLYWNLDREFYTANSQTGLSTREADANGQFKMKFAYNGEIVELVIIDKKLVNIIDTQDVLGLQFDENGVVIGQTNVRELATEVGKKIFVKKTTADTIVANSSMAMNGMELNLKMGQYAEIYDLRPDSETYGKKITTADLQVMDALTVYANADGDITHVYLLSSGERSKVYWRADLWISNAQLTAAHPADEDGIYTMDFFCEGERVTLKIKDEESAKKIISLGKHNAFTGLRFDEEGYVIGTLDCAVGQAGQQTFYALDITEIDGNNVKMKNNWSTSGVMNWEGVIPEETPIYDVSSWAYSEGVQGQKITASQLRVGDRITMWSDMDGNPIQALVTLRRVDMKPMFNNSAKYDNAAQATTRVKDADGYWTYTFISEKGLSKYKTKDQKLANFIDMYPERVFGLVTKGDKLVKAYDYETLYGYTRFSTALYVDSINGTIISCTDQRKANAYTAVLSADYQVLDISGDSKQWGQKIKLQPGDAMISFRNTDKEVCMIYVTKRSMGGSLYVVTNPNSGRTPEKTDENGVALDEKDWYWKYEVTDLNGNQKTLKLPVGNKDKDGVYANKYLQSRIDTQTRGIVALEVSGGKIKDAHAVANMASGNSVSTVIITKAGTTEFEYKTAAKPNDEVEIYPGWTGEAGVKKINLSGDYKSHKGEKLSGGMKVNDVYYMVRNRANETIALFLTSRGWHNDLFFVKNPYGVVTVKNEAGEDVTMTLRPQDANGYYVFTVMYDGKEATVRTKDLALATALESKNSGAALKLDKTERPFTFTGVQDYTGTGDAYANPVNNWDVSKISGKKITLTLNIPTASTTVGQTQEVDITGATVYNISPNAGADFGKTTKLQKNDRVRIFTDKTGKVSYVLVTVRNGVKVADCAHCGKKVTWNPLTANSGLGAGDAHYYIYADWNTYSALSVANTSIEKYEVVVDLNGKTLFNKGNVSRTFMVAYPGKTLTLMDSVGGGTMKSYGYDGNAGLIQVSYGATLNILSGTYQLVNAEGMITPKQGGVIFSWNDDNYPDHRNTVNIKGGTIIGAAIEHPSRTNGTDPLMEKDFAAGGAVYGQKTDFTMSGGKIYGGTADRGGNLYLGSTATFTMTGGEIDGGIARNRGGNVYMATGAKLVVDGGKITDGKIQGIDIEYEKDGEQKIKHTGQQGGNIVGYNVVLNSGEISGGSAKTTGGNIFLLGYVTETQEINGEKVKVIIDSNSFTMNGGKLGNGTAGSGGGNIYVYGGEGLVAVHGGEIDASGITIANETDSSGNVVTSSAMTVTGGKIGAASIQKTSAIVVGGDAKIDSLSLNKDAKMGITQLSSTAKIVVNASGAFAAAANGSEGLDIAPYAGNQIVSSDTKMGVISCQVIENVQWLVSGTKDMHEIYLQAPEKAIKMTTDGVFNAGGVIKTYCPACDCEEEWAPLTATMQNLATEGYTHYYLAGDITRADNSRYQIPADSKICIHLNGFTYDQAATSAVEGAIKVAGKATLNIMGNGTVIGAGSYNSTVSSYTGGAIDVRGTVNILGGTYKSSHNRPAVACFAASGAVLNMYAGKLEAGTAVTDNPGTYCGTFMMYDKSQTFNMYGGEIVGGDAGAYGNAKIVGGKANFFGGSISGRVVTGGSAIININNGAKIGAGNGGLVIKTGVTVNLADDLAAGTEVYISEPTEDEVGLTVANAKAGAYVEAGYIKSSNGARPAMVNTEDQIYIASSATAMNNLSATLAASTTEVEALCPLCGVKATWVPLTATMTVLDGGEHTHYYLAESITREDGNRFSVETEGSVICIHLNGKTYTQANTGNIEGAIKTGKNTVLNLMDAAENTGTVIGVGKAYDLGSNGTVNWQATGGAIDARGVVNIYGGTYKSNHHQRPAVSLWNENGTINMYGGKIVKGDNTVDAHSLSNNVRIRVSGATFNMYGGEISGGLASQGGNVYLLGGTFNMYGGTIKDGTAGNLGGNVRIAGGTFNMSGGEILNGTATSGSATGGSIGLSGSAVLNVSGGVIDGGTAAQGGVIGNNGATVNVSGTAVIKNGVAINNGGNITAMNGTMNITGGTITGGQIGTAPNLKANDLFVYAGKTVTLGKDATIGSVLVSGTLTVQNGVVATVQVSAGAKIALAADVAEGTKITVIATATQTIATIENAADFLGYFESGVSGATIGVKADTTNEIEIVVPVAE